MVVQRRMGHWIFDDHRGSCAETLQALQIAIKSYGSIWARATLTHLAFSEEKCATYIFPEALTMSLLGEAVATHPVTTIPIPASGVLWFSGG